MFKISKGRKALYVLIVMAFVLSLSITVSAQDRRGDLRVVSVPSVVGEVSGGKGEVSIIVLLEGDSLASYAGGVDGLKATSPQVTGARKLNTSAPQSVSYLGYLEAKQHAFGAEVARVAPEAKITYNYTVALNGVAMRVPASDVAKIANLPGVKSVSVDKLMTINTDASPDFVGAPEFWNELGGQGSAGEDTIIGVVDTGIWPEHPSFSDPDPLGNPYDGGPYSYTCDFGNTAWNSNDASFTCNNKLLGAYRFMATYDSIITISDDEFMSARDSDGHGSHTGSTSAGNAGVEASIMGSDLGVVTGIAPRAKVIAYKVCGGPRGSCYESDSAAAVQQAIIDGVDAINFSIGGGTNPYSDEVSLAFLDAFNAGVFVAASAGNSGPGADTTGHREPWVTTVAASTQERAYVGTVHLAAEGGDTLDLEGISITGGTTGNLVMGGDYGDPLCGHEDGVNPFPPGTFTPDQVVVCERGIVARVEKSANVMIGGGGGVILYNPTINTTNADNHFLPTVHIDDVSGVTLLDFIGTHTGISAELEGGILTTGQGDVMAAFSSRGGPAQTLGISKPDITAPGVNILAGMTPLPAYPIEGGGGVPGQLFQMIGGTSMSSPHIAGAGLLMTDMFPSWTPAMMKSALMLTANPDPVVKEDGVTPADAFDMGTGRLDLAAAWNPGLVFNEDGTDYMALEDELWNANYPSLYIPVMPGKITVERTVSNVMGVTRPWRLKVFAPNDLRVSVPAAIVVPRDGEYTFEITIDAREVPMGEVRFAELQFKHGTKILHFPITIVRQQPGVTLEKSCDPAVFPKPDLTECSITMTNNTYEDARVDMVDFLPRNIKLEPSSIDGGHPMGKNAVAFNGTLFGAGAPGVSVSESPSPYGYIPLSALGIPPFDLPSNPDDGGWLLSPFNFYYLGEHYTDVIWSINGTVEAGTASGLAASASNTVLPDPALPNNLLSPWWTDLDLSSAGNWYVGDLSDGVDSWHVFEWENAPRWGDPTSTFNFQIWIQEGTDMIWFLYSAFEGDTVDATVGAEDPGGLFGDTYYFEGTGTLPYTDLGVFSVPGTPGETHVVSFQAQGVNPGPWTNCAGMSSDAFFGVNIACFAGEVLPPPTEP